MRQSFVMEMVSGRKRTTASVSSSAKYTMILAVTFHWKIVIILQIAQVCTVKRLITLI